MVSFFNWLAGNWEYPLYVSGLAGLLVLVLRILGKKKSNLCFVILSSVLILHVIISFTWDIGRIDDMLLLTFFFIPYFVFWYLERRKAIPKP